MKKSKECIVAFMGIAYSGNYYCPIDISMPSRRVELIFETLKPAVVIEQRENQSSYNENSIIYDECMDKQYDDELINKQLNKVLSVDPLYVLFTSGSTGVPKGVVVSHASVIDYTEWLSHTFGFNENNVFGNQAPLYFDNSILDIYSSLKNKCEQKRNPIHYGKMHYSYEKPNNGILNLEWKEDQISAFLRSMDYSTLNVMGNPFIIENNIKYSWNSYKILDALNNWENIFNDKLIIKSNTLFILKNYHKVDCN